MAHMITNAKKSAYGRVIFELMASPSSRVAEAAWQVLAGTPTMPSLRKVRHCVGYAAFACL